MKSIHSRSNRIITLIVLITLVSVSITGISLLSLPFFYEQTSQARTMIFIGVSLFFSMLIFFASKVFILPFVRYFKIRSNLAFLIIISILLTVTIGLSYANLWAVPEIHNVKICFLADDESQSLYIEKLVDPNKNRLYAPNSFGFNRYPIIVESGPCISGRITKLVSRLTESLMGDQLTIEVQEAPPSGRFHVSINEVPAVVNFEQDVESQTSILYDEGFDHGRRIEKPWQQLWFFCLKMIAILFSSLFLSLFLFGFTERIQTFQANISNPLNGEMNAEK